MGTSSRKDQLKRLYARQHGICHWCREKMEPPGTYLGKGKPPPKIATFEHLYSRLHPERGKHPGEFINVAACWECNNRRGQLEQHKAPKEMLWQKSGAYPSRLVYSTEWGRAKQVGPQSQVVGLERLAEKYRVKRKGELT